MLNKMTKHGMIMTKFDDNFSFTIFPPNFASQYLMKKKHKKEGGAIWKTGVENQILR